MVLVAPLLDSAKEYTKKVKDLRDAREASDDPKRREALDDAMQRLFLQFNKRFNAIRWLRNRKP